MITPTEPWLSNCKASASVLSALLSAVPALPRAYIELLGRGNGGEVGLSVQPLNFCLDSAEAALDYWGSGTYTTENVFVFGSNGGGVYLGFDMSASQPWPIVSFDPIDPEGSMEHVAPDFCAFLNLVVHGDMA